MFELGEEFLGQRFKNNSFQYEYSILTTPFTAGNTKYNYIIECIHYALGNIIRTFELNDNYYVDKDNPWKGILAGFY